MAKRQKIKDPYAEREAQKYEKPIPSREVIMAMLDEESGPTTMQGIADALNLEGDEPLEALRRRLRAMERDGQLVRNRRDSYGLASKMDMVSGRIIGHPDGFGFLVPDDGSEDLFLTANQMRPLLHGDRVMVRVSGVDRRGRREGAVVEVLERSNSEVVGRFHMEHGVGFVIPDNKRITQDILISAEERGGAVDGQIVIAHIIEQPSKRSQPIGKIVEILGDHMAAGMEIDIAIRTHELPLVWPDIVNSEIAGIAPEVKEADKTGREDLRGLPLVTIDGEDARDFDDAVYCEPHGKGWRLLVAIADVSHYVDIKSGLDSEGRKRGNSVYFPGRVIPMLPEVLSNGLCSLNPKVDRLCMVCEMQVSAAGVVKKHRFFEGVMRSAARLTYTEVAAMVVDNDQALRSTYKDLLPHLDELHSLYNAFRQSREKRGTIDFETTETRIVFGRDRKIERIEPVERNDAHKMIEEFMIAANVAAAGFLLSHEIPALYRVHNGPSVEKLANLRAFLAEVGLSLAGGDEPEPKDYARLLKSVAGRDDAHLIQTVLLRSLSQAVYTPENNGHFGLAFDAYAHFTSPIRRYPDLLVHRALRHCIQNKKIKSFHYGIADMLAIGEHCSMTERRADEATRDATDWLKCEYMMEHVGEEFEGIVTSVTGFGLFVELKDIYVEGLAHISSFSKDYYHFDPVKHRLVGERTNTIYRLADTVRVKIVRVDLETKRIEFELAGQLEASTSSKGRKRKPSKKNTSQTRAGKNKKADKLAASPKKKKSTKKKTSKKKPLKNKKKSTQKKRAGE